ncbi:MAG: histidine phosphatase family protein [PS1 clade bacterium]|nr:histidine phosphatase family protein [PS1 clade bacterium]CAI8361100.1 MAG: phosphoglycerate mutase GpmB [Rhodobiaceae bacterium UBA7378]|tara:strand:+ start:387 stop:968 length:582 start_codon:yes stop_codon:yes gene_type:complete
MGKIFMVRHGKAAAGWDGDADPGLDAKGHAQASQVADKLATQIASPVPVYTSPLLRCRETAGPLAVLWQTTPIIEPRVAEIPSPIEDLTARTVWLRRVMSGSWDALAADPESVGHDYDDWRVEVIAALTGLAYDTDVVVFSHFIALNAAYSAATGAEDVVAFRPDNCSVSVFETDGSSLRLLQQGHEAETQVN